MSFSKGSTVNAVYIGRAALNVGTVLPPLSLSPLNHCLAHSAFFLAWWADLRHSSRDSSSSSPSSQPRSRLSEGRGRMCFTTCGPIRLELLPFARCCTIASRNNKDV
jgi:hypothetical protein